ncbi:MAG: sigma-70 family RNA polymerase sigma factor [Clostridia bacterium]|nr:sigma-70 family RNA polymerase sigma factor [Clostridia bacterium]
MSDSERLLLEKAKNGDVEAFEKLIEGSQKRVFNVALRMLGNHDDASEISQEVFIKVFKSIGSFKGNSSFSTWIYKITVNLCLDELRKRKNSRVISLDETIKIKDEEVRMQIEDDGPSPDVEVEKRAIRQVVTQAIEKLSDEHKVVVILRDIQGFSYDEIAKLINCPEGTVKSRINRARQSLKEILRGKKELSEEAYVK